ncbi:hypothetical protein ACFVFS_00525 [Kitasatospora sp. NPDC057692]|uniref:hypothetical protein n=1 Tax=Kitasatospora sp. NPDC057692 TaxID=3346215 RepID=UPI0036B4F8FD
MRFRALTAVSALTALTFLGTVPMAQAADSSAPASNTGVKIRKPTPELARAIDAARTKAAGSGPALQTAHVLCYQAHTRNAGWSAILCTDGAPGFTGTTGHNDPIDRVVFWVGGGLDFNTQLHWANDGTSQGFHVASGDGLELWNTHGNALEAIRLWSSNDLMKAAAHVQNVGWKGTDRWSPDQWIGSIGEARWMEAFWVAV